MHLDNCVRGRRVYGLERPECRAGRAVGWDGLVDSDDSQSQGRAHQRARRGLVYDIDGMHRRRRVRPTGDGGHWTWRARIDAHPDNGRGVTVAYGLSITTRR